jgi:ABC-type transport system involved in cytochrome c biogenesis ATPase subunit
MVRSRRVGIADRPVTFEVRNLFSRFTWRIALPTEDQPVRFLSAPNGYGKSTMLRILDDMAHQRWARIGKEMFESASLTFRSGAALTVTVVPESEDTVRLVFELLRPGEPTIQDEVRPFLVEATLPSELPSWIRQIGPDRFRDMRYGELLSTEELVQQLGRHAERRRNEQELGEEFDSVLQGLDVYYLDANRLLTGIRGTPRRWMPSHRQRRERAHAIQHISDVIEEVLASTRARSGRSSEHAEFRFPARILKALKHPPPADQLTPSSLVERYEKLRDREEELRSLGLTDRAMDAIPAQDLTEPGPAAIILDQMIAGIEKRFGDLEQTAKQLMLFRDTINGMLEDKSIEFEVNEMWANRGKGGLKVLDDKGRPIPLPALSSGEQHLIVMFGHILFASGLSAGGLVLLDEPEISLHPEWQIAVTHALKKVAAINDCRMLLATHSPTMIGDDWSSEIALTRTPEA